MIQCSDKDYGTDLWFKDFRKYFEEPILASRQPSADEDVISLGEERAMELNHRTRWFILRRTQEIINNFLPTRQELVVFCRSTPLQVRISKCCYIE